MAVTTHDQFSRMKFAPYVFREYPKMLVLAGGVERVVASRHEEILARGEDPGPEEAAANPVVQENLALKAQMEELQGQMTQLLSRLGSGGEGGSPGSKIASAVKALEVGQQGGMVSGPLPSPAASLLGNKT